MGQDAVTLAQTCVPTIAHRELTNLINLTVENKFRFQRNWIIKSSVFIILLILPLLWILKVGIYSLLKWILWILL